jgi:hypothetical protein
VTSAPVGGAGIESFVVVRDLLAGAGVVSVAGLLAVVLYPAGEPAGRILVLSAAVGLASRFLIVRAAAVTAVIAAGAFVYALAGAWPYTAVLPMAVMLGTGYRALRAAETSDGRQ